METALAGGVAVITGAARGIGEALARAAAARGMTLVLADIAAAPLAQLADDLRGAGSQVLDIQTDVSDPAALDRLADAAHRRFGGIRLLINNAGIEMLGYSWELSAAQWERAVRINALGPVHGVRAFAGAMVAAGEPAFIANVASVGALAMMPEQAPYIMTKHAVLAFSECLLLEMARAAPHIRVSAVLPGPVDTAIFTDAPLANDSAAIRHHHATMEHMLKSYGMAPGTAAEMILDQIAEGRFWVSPHPDLLAASAQARAGHLAGLRTPALSAEAAALLHHG